MSDDFKTGDFLRTYDINDEETYKRFVFADRMYKRIYKRLQKFIIASGAFTYNYASTITLPPEEVEMFFHVDKLIEGGESYITDSSCFKKVDFINCNEEKYLKLVDILYGVTNHFREGKKIVDDEEVKYEFYFQVIDLDRVSIEEDEREEEEDDDTEYNSGDSELDEADEAVEDGESLGSEDTESSMNSEEEDEETRRLATKMLVKHAKKSKFLKSESSDDEQEEEHQLSEDDIDNEADDVLEPVLKKNKITVDSIPNEVVSEDEL